MKEIYMIVKKHIDELDYMGLLVMGAPSDEYDLESKKIASLITNESSVEEITAAIVSVIRSSFGCDINATEKTIEVARKIKNDILTL